MNFERFGIVFTILLIGYILIVIILLSDNIFDDSDVYVLMISGLVLSLFTYTSQKKNPKKQWIMTDGYYHVFFMLGIFTGLGIKSALNFAYDIDYQNATSVDFTSGFLLAIGGQAGFYFFTLMAIVVSVINLRYIRKKVSGIDNTRWTPFIGGVTVGFGIMTVTNFVFHGIPPPW